MYCKHCGKEIDDNSTFCKHCGKSQGSTLKGLVNKPVWIIYFIWTLAHFYLLMGVKRDTAANFFYPFTKHIGKTKGFVDFPSESFYYYNWDKNYYDFSEFMVYVFIIPAIIYVVYRLSHKQIYKYMDILLNRK